MKTFVINKTKIITALLLLVMFSVVSFAKGTSETVEYLTYKGKTVDINTGDPIVFASVYVVGTNIGTVSNGDGEFILKLPSDKEEINLGASFIGYKPFEKKIFSSAAGSEVVIQLEPSPIPIQEVVIRSEDPYDLLMIAKRKITENYSRNPFMVTAFYREIIQQNKSYIGVSEAVLDVYKSAYSNSIDHDRVKIYKGRKSMNVKKMDTLLFKLQGGPRTSFLLDVVKNPGGLLSDEFMEFYNYDLEGVIEIDDRQTYVISFDQKDDVDYPLYSGKIYLDEENLAISSIEFKISDKTIDKAVDEYIRKRPLNLKASIENANYLVNYRKINNTWYFNSIKSNLALNCKWDKKLFKSKYMVALEMVVTDMEFEKVDRFKQKESVGMADVFADNVDYFSDPNFWGNYNTIKPEESIETAISRLNRKIVR